MKVRLIKNPNITGFADIFNTSTIGEVIMAYDADGGMDSVYISELEVLIHTIKKVGYAYLKTEVWIPLKTAFNEHLVITDDYNTRFFESIKEEKKASTVDDEEVGLAQLKKEIYDVMKKYFNGFDKTNHDVAEDFSARELEDFINEYYNYLLK